MLLKKGFWLDSSEIQEIVQGMENPVESRCKVVRPGPESGLSAYHPYSARHLLWEGIGFIEKK